jgi:Spy/CpxP family protein refolding chaperone
MKQRNRNIAIVALSALLFTSAGTAVAFGGHKGHGGCDRDGRGGPMTAALMQIDSLTDDQKGAIKDIRKSTRDAMQDLRDEMRDNRRDLRDAMEDEADMDTIRSLAKKQGDQIARMIVLRAEVRNKINTVLNEEQRQQLQDMRWSGKGFGPGPKGF